MNPESFTSRKLIYFFSFLILALGIRFAFFYQHQPRLINGQNISFSTTLLEEPSINGKVTSFWAYDGDFLGKQKVYVTTNMQNELSYGDRVQISGTVSKKVLNKNKIMVSITHAGIVTETGKKNPILAVAQNIRQKVQAEYFFTLSTQSASLLYGIVFGIKGNFSKDFFQKLQASGVLHVIAASGMNITLLAGVLFSVTNNFLKRQFSLLITLGGIFSYVVLSGFQPSILRATMMCSFAYIAQMLGRQYSGLYGLILAGSILLFYNPILLFDIGFQLSIMATSGIILLHPMFPKASLLEDMFTTLSAQLATLPILLTTFGTYGLFSVLVNALVLWTIPPLMILGTLGAVGSFIFSPIADIFIWLCAPLLWFFETVVDFFGGIQATVTLKEIPMAFVGGYYLLLIASLLFLKRLKKT